MLCKKRWRRQDLYYDRPISPEIRISTVFPLAELRSAKSRRQISPHFPERHIEHQGVLGRELPLDEAHGPSFRDRVQHQIEGSISRRCGKPDLDLTIIGGHAHQMNLGCGLHKQ